MKRGLLGVITLLFLVLFLQDASATITFNGPTQTQINLGDTLHIDGYILHDTDTTGTLTYELICDDTTLLTVESTSIQASTPKPFTKDFTITTPHTGTCTIALTLKDTQGTPLEQHSSTPFTITSQLTATLTAEPQDLQVGDTITLTGNIFTKTGSPVSGTLAITATKDGTTHFTDTTSFTKGTIDHSFSTTNMLGGTYTLHARIQDTNGNTQDLDVSTFTLSDDIFLETALKQVTLLPGEKISLTGTATLPNGKNTKGTAYLLFEGVKHQDTILFGKFDFSIPTETTITSGEHTLQLRIENDQGGYGEKLFTITILPVPTSIHLTSSHASIQPGESMTLRATLLDQAGGIMNNTIGITITNTQNTEVFTNTYTSTQDFDILIDKNLLPGTYTITAFTDTITKKAQFYVGERYELSYTLNGQKLSITNTGNTPYKEPLTITYTTGETASTLVQPLSLNIQKTTTINLGKYLPTGIYTIHVGDTAFEDVSVTRQYLFTWWQLLIFLLAIAFLVYYYHRLTRPKESHKHSHHARFTPRTPTEKGFTHHKKGYLGEVMHDAPKKTKTRNLTQEDYARRFKHTVSLFKETSTKPLKFEVKKREPDEYVYDLPTTHKREQQEQPSWPDHSQVMDSRDVFSGATPAWKKESQKKDASKKDHKNDDNGLFNMFS